VDVTFSVSNTSLTSSTAYAYYLSASGSPSSTASSNQAGAMTLPTAPTGLTAAASGGDVLLSWSDPAQDADDYEILSSTDDSTFTEVGATDGATTTYDDWAAADGVTDYYEVVATNLGGTSAPTAVASATPIASIEAVDDDMTSDGEPYQVSEGVPSTLSASALLANDNDPNNDPILTISSFTQPSHGTLTDNGGGTYTYQPNSGYIGIDSFTYTPTDQYGASANQATVSFRVGNTMPMLESGVIYLWYSPVPQMITGALLADDVDGNAALASPGQEITYSVVSQPASGAFALNTSTGYYTYTTDPSSTGRVAVVCKANDGMLDSNLATIIFTQASDPVLAPALNPSYDVGENGCLQVYGTYSGGLLGGAMGAGVSISSILQQPTHGMLSAVDEASGGFIYQPTPGFLGYDSFTYAVLDNGKFGGYATAFIYVYPVTLSLSVNSLKPGDTTAIIPSTEFPPDANGDPQYAAINLNGLGILPDGSQVTLSISSDFASDLDVYDAIPASTGANVIVGKDAESASYTWTVGDANNPPPSTVYAVGLSGTDYDQVTFTLSIALATQTVGTPPSPASPPPPATQPIVATQQATVQGKDGYLAAFDGTWQIQSFNTAINRFLTDYTGKRNYNYGVGNTQRHPELFDHLINGAIGGPDAGAILQIGWNKLVNFYQDASTWGAPVDTIGWSRGAFEAIMLAWDVTAGIPNLATKVTRGGNVTYHYIPPIPIRFVGLISPVGQMGPGQEAFWRTTLPAGVKYFAEAGDIRPLHPIYPESVINAAPGTTPAFQQFPYSHGYMGYEWPVLHYLETQARIAGVPVNLSLPFIFGGAP
jgi:hypothetical protein